MTDAANMLKSTILLITEMIQILEESDDPEAPQAFFEAYNEASGQLNASVYHALHPLLRAQSRERVAAYWKGEEKIEAESH